MKSLRKFRNALRVRAFSPGEVIGIAIFTIGVAYMVAGLMTQDDNASVIVQVAHPLAYYLTTGLVTLLGIVLYCISVPQDEEVKGNNHESQ